MLLDHSYIDAYCECKSLSDVVLTQGKIIKVSDTFIEFSNEMGVESLIKYEKKVKVIIHHPYHGLKEISGDLFLPTMHFFRVMDHKAVETKDQRNFFRVSTHTHAKCSVVAKSGGILREYEGLIQDISLGGVFMVIKGNITLKQNIFLQFTINQHTYQVYSTIVRVKSLSYPEMGYGIEFDDLNQEDANHLCHYLFTKQKEVTRY